MSKIAAVNALEIYQVMTERFVRAANDDIARVAADSVILTWRSCRRTQGFHARRQFYFTHLMHATGGTPVT